MRFLYFVQRFPNVSETFVLNEIRELTRLGDEITIVSRSPPDPAEPVHPSAEVFAARTHYCSSGLGRIGRLRDCVRTFATCRTRAIRAGWLCLRLAAHSEHSAVHAFLEASEIRASAPEGIDVVQAHFAYCASTGAVLARLLGCPFSFTGHAVDVFQFVPERLLRAQIAEARVVIASSDATKQRMLSVASERDRGKIVFVRYGTDRTLFRPRDSEPPGVPVILCVARLVDKKGIDTLLEALAILAERKLTFRCEVIGDGPLRSQLEALARALDLNGRVEFRGDLAQPKVADALRRACVLALPCRQTATGDRDGTPNVLIEAMATGVPVVAGDAGGVAEVVIDGRTGLLVQPNAAPALADALDRVLQDRELRATLIRGGFDQTARSDIRDCVPVLRSLLAEVATAGA